MADSEVKVTLTADITQYVQAIRTARREILWLRLTHDIPALAVGAGLGIIATLAAVYIR